MSKSLGNSPLPKKIFKRYYTESMDTFFENTPLFNNLSAETFKIIEPLFEPCVCHEGTIFKQGDPAIHLYLLTSGSVDILYKPYDAPVIAITSVKPGGIFGWSAISENALYTSGARCRIKCQAMRMQGSFLRELCIQRPHMGEILLDILAESVSTRWKDAHSQVRDILSHGVSSHLQN